MTPPRPPKPHCLVGLFLFRKFLHLPSFDVRLHDPISLPQNSLRVLAVMKPPVHLTALGHDDNWQVLVAFLLGLVLGLLALAALLAVRL
jgi:hypothetical protein